MEDSKMKTKESKASYGILAILMIGAFVALLSNTLLNIALPSIMKDFDVNGTVAIHGLYASERDYDSVNSLFNSEVYRETIVPDRYWLILDRNLYRRVCAKLPCVIACQNGSSLRGSDNDATINERIIHHISSREAWLGYGDVWPSNDFCSGNWAYTVRMDYSAL